MKAAFHTLGCKTNAYETQAIREQFEQAGFLVAGFSEQADVYVINTCSVTAVAAQKSRQMIHRCKKKSPDAVVVACGCYAQEAAEKLMADGGVDLVVGNNEKSKILELVLQKQNDLQSVRIRDLTRCEEYENQTITNAGTHVRAFVKIQDGCNRFCSYCVIPYLRGRSRSREVSEVLKEVKTLAGSGVKEIVLTGIDISDYRYSLETLIFEIEEIDTIERIRLGSLEAGVVTEAFLDAIAKSRKLCPHFHLSLQSGCDATLKRMNRHYTTAEFKETVDRIRDVFRDPAVTTDVIAGFAGESEEEFAETKRFVQEIGFSEMHVFPYSRRKGTRADRMPGQLTKAEKATRAAELIEIGAKMQRAYMERFLGKEVQILTEETVRIEGGDFLIGFTPEYIKAAVPAKADKKINKIVTLTPSKIIEFQKEPIFLSTEA